MQKLIFVAVMSLPAIVISAAIAGSLIRIRGSSEPWPTSPVRHLFGFGAARIMLGVMLIYGGVLFAIAVITN